MPRTDLYKKLSGRILKTSVDCVDIYSPIQESKAYDKGFFSTGKGGGGLNLGNFFASHKGYSRKGFDRLSTEGSDQEKDEDDGTDSEEEYSPPPPPPAPSSS